MGNHWENDILELEKRSKGIYDADMVFLGSSSFTIWSSMEDDFKPFKILNHGFGGSGLSDALYFFERLVTPFNPRILIVYSGSNDITGSPLEINAAAKALDSVKKLYEKTKTQLPDTLFCYISINITRLRFGAQDEIRKANELIRNLSLKSEDFIFIDTVESFLKDGLPDESLFLQDKLHLNGKGYAKWLTQIKPVVSKILIESKNKD